jgi:hypothetical protein
LGNAAGQGGFFFTTRWAISSTTALQRTAVGLFSVTTAISTTQSPSALTNCFFMGNDSADTNMQIMHNDGSGTATKVALGASFPKPSAASTNFYRLTLDCVGGSGVVSYVVQELSTGVVASGSVSSDLPASATGLNYYAAMSAGGTSTQP